MSATILPTVPSKLLRIGLTDLRHFKKQPGNRVDMSVWCQFNESENKCIACLAGAVMIDTLEGHKLLTKEIILLPSNFRENECQLSALDALRAGDIQSACYYLGVESKLSNRYVRGYTLDPIGWFEDMETLIKDLEAEGL